MTELLASCVPVERLREAVREHGVSPKGYRVDRAPAAVLAKALAEPRNAKVFEAAARLFVDAALAAPGPDGGKKARRGRSLSAQGGTAASDAAPVLDPAALARAEKKAAAAEKSLARRTVDLDKTRQQVIRSRERADDLAARLREQVEDNARRTARIDDLQRQLAEQVAAPGRATPDADRNTQSRIADLERDLAAVLESEEGLRRLLAARTSRIRELEAEVEHLIPLVPTSELKRRRIERAAEPEPIKVRVPYLTPEFYRSLEGKERRSIERAVHAILMFCTEGPGYPGLEVKRLEGQELWSLRAALKLRVYFRFRDDGDVDVLMLADRGDQRTLLRRMKERGS